MISTQRVEISDSKNGILAFDLKEVLDALPELTTELTWHLLALEAVGKGLHGESMLVTEDRINSSPHGITLRFAELQEFARTLEQTLNATIVGMAEGEAPPSLPLRLPYATQYIVVEGIDSSIWAITSNESAVVRRALECFENTTLIPAAIS